jgi:hypothetical protein
MLGLQLARGREDPEDVVELDRDPRRHQAGLGVFRERARPGLVPAEIVEHSHLRLAHYNIAHRRAPVAATARNTNAAQETQRREESWCPSRCWS